MSAEHEDILLPISAAEALVAMMSMMAACVYFRPEIQMPLASAELLNPPYRASAGGTSLMISFRREI